jgi:hypothetical protein
MRTSSYAHYAHQVRHETIGLLHQQLQPCNYSKRCSSWWVLSCLILIAAARLSLAAVAALRDQQSRETLRQALLATLPDYQRTLRQLPRLLRASLPRGLRKRFRKGGKRRRYPLALDLHAVPYFKRKATPPPRVRKGKPLPGTAYSHQYATAVLLHKGRYYTVALTPYLPGEDLATLVKRLLQQATANGFPPRYLLLDRYFWSVDVFRYLQQARYPFMMPMLARGKKASTPGGPTGTRAFLHGHPSGWYVYRITKRHGHKKATVNIGVERHNERGKRGRHGRWARAYAVWRMPVANVVNLHESYRRRFRIESSYRLLEAARGRTSSRNETLRLWYVLVAIIMLNRWLELRREASRRSNLIEQWWNQLLTTLIFVLLQESYADVAAAATAEFPLRE